MPIWRCPHCGTPQAETARCWVCRRSSTSCGTCRHFRRSVAAQIGYCGLDRRRQPLAGDEIRGCWEGWPAGASAPSASRPTIGPAALINDAPAPRQFVEVTDAAVTGGRDALSGPVAATASGVTAPAEPGWSLWGDLEP